MNQQLQGRLDWLMISFPAGAGRGPRHHGVGRRAAAGLLRRSAGGPGRPAAAVISGLASLTNGAARVMSAGPVRQTIVDMDGGVMLVMSVGDRALLGVLAAPGCDLGQVGYETAMLVHRVADALDPLPGARAAARGARR